MEDNRLICLSGTNIYKENICCALGSKKNIEGVDAKKSWLIERFEEGLKFIKLNIRGKIFIEYLPADKAWVPIVADGYTFINCHWVSGSNKGKGYGKQLLDKCEEDSKDTNGIVLIVGSKKKPFLSDKSFYIKNGYEVCDECKPYFQLLVKRFNDEVDMPKFKECASKGLDKDTEGIDIYYTKQCPFTIPYTNVLEPIIKESSIPVRIHEIDTRVKAQNHKCPITTYSVFVNGAFYTNEILTSSKLEKLVNKISK
ncbi:GNAT family N-acetyltransferase [Marinilabiliaceae bacterium JC040]|nr:GNAT family N-acetyltransferase [Marinilabiliaceae bacterium JC040]